jgi:threonine aldolase
VESFTNQQFVILTEQQKQELAQKYYFEDEGDTQRFCTSWATTEDEVDMLVTDIEKL